MTPLHHLGEFFRTTMLQVPLPLVRLMFVAAPLAVLIWVLLLPGEQTRPPGEAKRWDSNLKVWAAVALGIQVVIYGWL